MTRTCAGCDTLADMSKPKQKPIRVSVFVPAEIDAKIGRIARDNGESKSSIYCGAVTYYLNSFKKKAAA